MANKDNASDDTCFVASMGLEAAIQSGKINNHTLRWFAIDCVERGLEREEKASQEQACDNSYSAIKTIDGEDYSQCSWSKYRVAEKHAIAIMKDFQKGCATEFDVYEAQQLIPGRSIMFHGYGGDDDLGKAVDTLCDCAGQTCYDSSIKTKEKVLVISQCLTWEAAKDRLATEGYGKYPGYHVYDGWEDNAETNKKRKTTWEDGKRAEQDVQLIRLGNFFQQEGENSYQF